SHWILHGTSRPRREVFPHAAGPSVLFLLPQLPCLLAPVHSSGSIVQPGSLPAYIRGPISGESSRRRIADCTVRTNRAIAHPYSCRHGAFEQPIVGLDQGRTAQKHAIDRPVVSEEAHFPCAGPPTATISCRHL